MDDQNSQPNYSIFDYNFPYEDSGYSDEESENNQLSGSDSETMTENSGSFEKYHSGL